MCPQTLVRSLKGKSGPSKDPSKQTHYTSTTSQGLFLQTLVWRQEGTSCPQTSRELNLSGTPRRCFAGEAATIAEDPEDEEDEELSSSEFVHRLFFRLSLGALETTQQALLAHAVVLRGVGDGHQVLVLEVTHSKLAPASSNQVKAANTCPH